MGTNEQVLDALGDPTRRQILERLRHGPCPVGAIAAGLPVTRSAVSQHLRVLREAGLVGATRDGTKRVYGIRRQGLEQLRAYLDAFWDDVLAGFKDHAEMEGEPR